MVASLVIAVDKPKRSQFSPAERRAVYRAIYERRDIRSQFLPQPIPDAVLGRLLDAAHHGPSVGYMQPWDFIVIRDVEVRRSVYRCFVEANRRAAECYKGERLELYSTLKLAGILESPVNLCITCDRARTLGAGLGRQTDPATDLYSTVCAIQNLWLAARAESLGVGWVSILDFDQLRAMLRIPERIVPVAYLCVGYVSEFPDCPDLETAGWERREKLARLIHFESWDIQDNDQAAGLLTPDGDGTKP
jgi:5,6-dimethylbenzimidazole synthase